MNENIYGPSIPNKRSIRSIHQNNIAGQASFERQFDKQNKEQLSELYFSGKAPVKGARVNPMKNNSSNERVFGLGDMPKTQYVPSGSRAMGEPFGKRQYSRGRGSGSQQGGILDFGNYG